MAEILVEEGYVVLTARDGQEALQTLQDSAAAAAPVDLVILDLMMPTMNGWDFYSALQETPGLEGTRILVYTAAGPAAQRNAAMVIRPVAMITKPVGLGKFLGAIKEALGG